MNEQNTRKLLARIIEDIEIPESSYTRAEERYHSLGDWLGREGSSVAKNEPHIFPQGSFRLGTVIKPLDPKEDFDLDLSCKLCVGITKQTHTQFDIKQKVQVELESFRQSKHIQENLDEKKRCWRLIYKGELGFHLDVVPCIPETQAAIGRVKTAMMESGEVEQSANRLAALTVAITDNTNANYRNTTEDWPVSNPEGYAKWFETRRTMRRIVMDSRVAGQVDDLPPNTKTSILQRCVKLLKRHRDLHFIKNKDAKTISIIITTLAARAYEGEQDLLSALRSILSKMEALINKPGLVRIPNPVNPKEDFADKWSTPEGMILRLEENTRKWIQAARQDLETIMGFGNSELLSQVVEKYFGISISKDFAVELIPNSAPEIPRVNINTQTATKPWLAIDE